ncbi:MAG: M23 family metallopeptidase, partial [Flavobacteriales bacterium]
SKKAKYKYDPNTLQYQKIELTLREVLKKILKYTAVGLVIAGVIILISYPFIQDYSTRKAQKKIAFLESNYHTINSEMDTIVTVLKNLQETDNNLYRVIFEAEPYKNKELDRKTSLGKKTHEDIVISLKERLNSLTKSVVGQSKSFESVVKLALNKEKLLQAVPSIIPIEDKELTRLSSPFGIRNDPIYNVPKMHSGLDFTAPTGSKIYASGDGIVETMEYSTGGYGNHVIINHGFGYKSHYAHMDEFKTRVGKKVKRGELIGLVGSTGKSTAPHLHYEVIKNGNKIDPINFFYNDITPDQYQQMLEKAKNTGGSSLD